MNRIMTKQFKRIDKRVARRYFEQGQDIYLAPCYLNPDNNWMPLYEANISDWGMSHVAENNRFEYLCREYSFYNCNNELGRYISFYIKTE